MLLLASATLGVCWFTYVKSQARVIASKAVFQLNQPDSNVDEVISATNSEFVSNLSLPKVQVSGHKSEDLSEVRISLAPKLFATIPGITFPKLEVTAHEVRDPAG